MVFQEPVVEFVRIGQDVTTWNSTCPDQKKCDDDESGGTVTCNTSYAEDDCQDIMPLLG